MAKRNSFSEINWLQISDLHIYDSTDLNMMLDSYRKLAQKISIQFLVVTGDYRHKKDHPDYTEALNFLNKIVSIFKLDKNDVFLVPGNHDVENYEMREEIIENIQGKIEKVADQYVSYMDTSNICLGNAFGKYCDFVHNFYDGKVADERVTKPWHVQCIPWNNRINIVILNTALISDGNKDHKEILDIKTLSSLDINDALPTIVLAHHDINSLVESHKKRILKILSKIHARAYLCGDKHKLEVSVIDKYDVPEAAIPCIVCGKSAVQQGDDYSDVSVILYSYKADGNAYVQVYKWGEKFSFVTDSKFYHNIDEQYYFYMGDPIKDIRPTKQTKGKKVVNKLDASTSKPISIWLPDAELAEGRQTRFNSYTKTDAITKYFDNKSGSLGIVSVKGIGKTFVLQVKRINSSRKYVCLPAYQTPSIDNNWATERVSFDTYANLKTNNPYDDLVLLWKYSIMCYVINHLQQENKDYTRTINEYHNTNKIKGLTRSLCINENNLQLEFLLKNVVAESSWIETVKHDSNAIRNMCQMFLSLRRRSSPRARNFAIFIDKVDQAIKQTNAEPPADCVVCKKYNSYLECTSKRKGPRYCFEDSGCQSKNCCYGCEVFASPESNSGLRIYENSNAAKRVHVNLWQYLQIALMNAAGQISEEFKGSINVFYTIRQEALHCEEYRIGEQNQKVAGRLLKLEYSFEDHKRIFVDCIKEQEDCYLYDPTMKNKKGEEEYAFVGVYQLCHPYCKREDGSNVYESIFECIYRHSFDRSRDIQRFGEELTNQLPSIKACKNQHVREEKVKSIIEDMAASLAYNTKKTESTVNISYYTEKMRYLPNYWADNENFEQLLMLIDRNLLFEDDVQRICRKVNGFEKCPVEGCKSTNCKRHPFSMLYNMGYMGYIIRNSNNDIDDVQIFLDASEISYFVERDDLNTVDRAAYIIHPALTKTIGKKFNKSFMHFTGFILGKGLQVDVTLLDKMLDDRKQLTHEEFISKYYYKP